MTLFRVSIHFSAIFIDADRMSSASVTSLAYQPIRYVFRNCCIDQPFFVKAFFCLDNIYA